MAKGALKSTELLLRYWIRLEDSDQTIPYYELAKIHSLMKTLQQLVQLWKFNIYSLHECCELELCNLLAFKA